MDDVAEGHSVAACASRFGMDKGGKLRVGRRGSASERDIAETLKGTALVGPATEALRGSDTRSAVFKDAPCGALRPVQARPGFGRSGICSERL